MGRLFDSESDKVIKDSMEIWGHLSDRFVKISKLIPPFSPKQICHRWNNELDPRLTRGRLTNDEKEFVYNWVNENRTADGTIHWKFCRLDMQSIFNKFYSSNQIKNTWNSKQKQLTRKPEARSRPSINNDFRSFITLPVVNVNDITTPSPPSFILPNFQPSFPIPIMKPVF